MAAVLHNKTILETTICPLTVIFLRKTSTFNGCVDFITGRLKLRDSPPAIKPTETKKIR